MKTKRINFAVLCLTAVIILFGLLALTQIAAGAEEKVTPTVSAAGVVSWENFGDDEYKVVVVNNQSQLVINQSVGYALSYDLKAKLDELERESGDYKITISSKKEGNNVSSNQVTYSYTSAKIKLSTPANLCWNGSVANWDAVENATSYGVVLTDGNGGVIVSKTNSETSYDFAENIKNGATFKVVAKANGYLDSAEAESSPSKSFVVKFMAGSGSGTKDKVILTPAGDDTVVEYTLPNPGGFYAPSGKIFNRWSVEFLTGPNKEEPISFAKTGEVLTVNGDVNLTATWKDEAYTVTLYANDGKGTQQTVEDVYGSYVLPECSFDAPEGKEFDCWAIGSELGEQKKPAQGINVYNDTLIIALWREKAFTVAPQNTTLTTGEAYVFDYKLSVDAIQINIQSYNGLAWENFAVLASPAPAINTLTSGTIYCPAVGWTGTKTLRLNAFDSASNQYYSDVFTVSWIESVFNSQPTSATAPLGASVLITYGLNITPDNVKIQVDNGGGWEHLSAADGEAYTILEGYDSAVTKTYRIEVVKDSNTFYSNSFTVEWSDSAEAYAFNQQFDNATVKVGDAYNLPWSVNFGTTSQNIFSWNEQLEIWEHYDGDGEGYTLIRDANAVNDYDFQVNSQTVIKFKIVVSVGDGYELSSNEFTISWASYSATFKANGVEGADVVVDDLYGEYILPECSFTAPAGKVFAGWAAGSAEGTVYKVGEAYDVVGATEFYAVWEDYTLVDTYAKLVEAIAAGKRYIKLTANISHDAYSNIDFANSQLVFNGNGATVIDLAGYTLKFTNESTFMSNSVAWIEVKNGYQLTVKNGTMILQNNNADTDHTAYGVLFVENATLITENVNIQNKKNGSCVRAYSGTVVLNGGELQTLAGWTVYAMYDVALTLDGDVCLRIQNHANASSSVAGGLYVLTEDVTLDIRKACIKDGLSLPEAMRPTLETHVFYVNGVRMNSELGLYATNGSATAAGATTYWLDQGSRIYLADVGEGNDYLANGYVVLTSKAVKHSITVENGAASVGGNAVSEGYYTQTITVTANEIEGKVFVEWTYVGETGVVFADPHSVTTTFEMIDGEITVVPTYKNAPITHINITIAEPMKSEEFSRYATVDHEGLKITTNCYENPDWKLEWSCLTDSLTNMEYGSFLPGKEYKVALRVEIVNGDWEIDDPANLYVTINGVVAQLGYTSGTVAIIYTTYQISMPEFEVPFTDDSRAGLGGWLKVDTASINEYSSEFANADSIEYLWYKNDKLISGVTDSSYKIKPEDANSKIYVLVKATWNGFDYYGLSEAKTVNHKVSVIYINYDPIEGGCYIPYNRHNLFSVADPDLGAVKAVDWKNSSMVAIEEGDLLEEGAIYNIFLMYQLKGDYVWADDIVFCINGGELVLSDYADPTNKIIAKLVELTAAEHTHTYENEIYAYDDDGHWLRCDNVNCANRDEDYYQYVDHISNDATCQTTGSCAVCGKSGIEGTHVFENGEYVKTSEEYHEVKCLYCDATDGMENPHFGGTATCTAKAVCEGCHEAYGDYAQHPGYSVTWDYKDENGHAHVCTANGCNAYDEIVPHTPGPAATEDDPQVCTVCGYIIEPATGHVVHTPKPEWKTDANYHWHECIGCEGQELEKAAHGGGTATCTAKAVCSVCGVEYGNFAEHAEYSATWDYKDENGHAHVCTANGCNAYDEIVPHTPGPAATEDDPQVCTVCGYIIEPATGHVAHTPKPEWETDANYHWHECIGCEGQELDKAAHTPAADDGDCTTAILCTVCGAVTTEAKTSHSGGTASCTELAKCTLCSKEYGSLASHTPAADDGDCTTAILCTVCGAVTTEAKTSHSGGTASCTELAKCAICSKEYGSLASHTYVEGSCSCGATDPDYQQIDNGDSDGLGAGAIAGIVVGSVAVTGVGGFSLIWFVIKKKSFADLIAVFKK